MYIYTHRYIHTQIRTHTYIYIIFVNLVEALILVHNYFVDHFVICLTIMDNVSRYLWKYIYILAYRYTENLDCKLRY